MHQFVFASFLSRHNKIRGHHCEPILLHACLDLCRISCVWLNVCMGVFFVVIYVCIGIVCVAAYLETQKKKAKNEYQIVCEM